MVELCDNLANVGTAWRAVCGWWGARGASVAFALCCRCLRARSGRADRVSAARSPWPIPVPTVPRSTAMTLQATSIPPARKSRRTSPAPPHRKPAPPHRKPAPHQEPAPPPPAPPPPAHHLRHHHLENRRHHRRHHHLENRRHHRRHHHRRRHHRRNRRHHRRNRRHHRRNRRHHRRNRRHHRRNWRDGY